MHSLAEVLIRLLFTKSINVCLALRLNLQNPIMT